MELYCMEQSPQSTVFEHCHTKEVLNIGFTVDTPYTSREGQFLYNGQEAHRRLSTARAFTYFMPSV